MYLSQSQGLEPYIALEYNNSTAGFSLHVLVSGASPIPKLQTSMTYLAQYT